MDYNKTNYGDIAHARLGKCTIRHNHGFLRVSIEKGYDIYIEIPQGLRQ